MRKGLAEPINIEVYLGGAPLLELRVFEGLLRFGQSRPRWRFAIRGPDFRYSREWLRRRNVTGALVMLETEVVESALSSAGIPWVHILPTSPVTHPFVNVDDYAIGRQGAEFFLDKGFRRFAFCGVGTVWSNERGVGFRYRLQEAETSCTFIDIPFGDSKYWELAPDYESHLKPWLARLQRGTAIMVAHDALANRVIDLALAQGHRIPEDFAVLGVGDHRMLCEISPVPFSSINSNVPQVAVAGAEMLERLIENQDCPTSVCVPPLEVVERRSTERLAYEDELVAEIVAYIRDHVAEGVTVADLLEKFPVSRRTLARRFAEYVGHSPGAEVRQARLKHAVRLVKKNSLSLSEIALASGYADLAHFDRSCRQHLGIRPSDLR